MEQIQAFQDHLVLDEKSSATVEKYVRDAHAFFVFAEGREITKKLVISYKNSLVEQGYAPRSINSMLASINSLLRFFGWQDCTVRSMKLQKQIYCPAEKALTKAEYMRLLDAAKQSRQERLYFVLQAVCGTGIRISELKYFTVESVRQGDISVSCKNKTRHILIPKKLRRLLLQFAKDSGIACGVIFRTKSGKPLDRSNVWAEMKKLCGAARVDPQKVFPHNLRKLFARTFYRAEKDIARLADILGHASVNTTRIYIIETGSEHRKRIERLGLVV